MTATITERVARGAALLDEKEPGWWKRIDLDALNLNHCNLCVLGQLLGDDSDPVAYLTKARKLGILSPTLAGRGFELDDLPPGDEETWAGAYDELAAEWKRVITERRAAA